MGTKKFGALSFWGNFKLLSKRVIKRALIDVNFDSPDNHRTKAAKSKHAQYAAVLHKKATRRPIFTRNSSILWINFENKCHAPAESGITSRFYSEKLFLPATVNHQIRWLHRRLQTLICLVDMHTRSCKFDLIKFVMLLSKSAIRSDCCRLTPTELREFAIEWRDSCIMNRNKSLAKWKNFKATTVSRS